MNKAVRDRIDARLGRDLSENRIEAVRICEMLERVGESYYAEYTDFLEAEVRLLIEEIAVAFYKDVVLSGSCGFQENDGLFGERFMLGAMSRELFEQMGNEGFVYPLTVLKLTSTDLRFEPRHRDVLGSLMGLGIRREKIGDIKIKAKSENASDRRDKAQACAYIVVEEAMAEFVRGHLVKIGPWQVSLAVAEASELSGLKEDSELCTFTVKSMRLDALLAEGFNLSRDLASRLVESGKVKVNHRLEESKSKEIKSGDLISARGYGRLRILSTGDRTRKDRLWTEAMRYR